MLAQNIIIVWGSTHASIPSGFTRETTLDDKYPKATADSVNPNVPGGNSTHTHSSPAHTHTMNSHTHTYNVSTVGASGGDAGRGGVERNCTGGSHTHARSGTSTSGGSLSSVTSNYDATANDPEYNTVIFIKASGYGNVPDDGIILTDDASIPSGFQNCDGTNSTPDLRNKYIKGASNGADAGGSGGSYTNTHTLTHSHVTSNHTHSSSTTSASGQTNNESTDNPPNDATANWHSHTVTFGNKNDTISATKPSVVCDETVEPGYKKLLAIINTSGAAKGTTVGMIGMWLGTLSSVPAGWFLCDGNNGTPDMRTKFLKIASTTGQIGDTGGSNTHTHAAKTHTHTANGTHTHASMTINNHVAGERKSGGGYGQVMPNSDSHSVSSQSSVTSVYSSTNTTAESSNNEPEYRTVAYIQYQFDVGGGVLYGLL